MDIQFLGATQTVTGSKYLIQTNKIRFLVDCGLFQGYKTLRLRNRQPIPIDAHKIDYVLLSHAHIDHSGYIPLLVKNGFKGKVLCTGPTFELCKILLPDSGYLQEEEARYANLKGYSKHNPALPLYTREDAENSLKFFHPVHFDKWIPLGRNVECQFRYAGHILGASSILVKDQNTSIFFSGDVGRLHDPIMRAPVAPPAADYYVIESTYGDRLHEPIDPLDQLEDVINRTIKRGGVVLMPSFAVGRAQAILFYLHQLKRQHRIPDVPIYLDSPMATNATKLFCQHDEQHRLSPHEADEICSSANYIKTPEESYDLDTMNRPMIIISASGMATGGRVLHHIKHFTPDSRNCLIFCGYQAGGTRGDRILHGEQEIKMFGKMIPINCEVVDIENTSAHADYSELLHWLSQAPEAPRTVFLTHGEMASSESMKEKIQRKLRWSCQIPEFEQQVELTKSL